MKKYLTDLFEKTSEKLTYLKDVDKIFTIPNQQNYGDYSTNIALLLSKKLKKSPRDVANEIISTLDYD